MSMQFTREELDKIVFVKYFCTYIVSVASLMQFVTTSVIPQGRGAQYLVRMFIVLALLSNILDGW